MKHPLLSGEYELTIDEKHRLGLPAEVRREFQPEHGEGVYVVIGRNRVPWMYSIALYEEMAQQIPAQLAPGVEQLEFDQYHFGMAQKRPWDKTGRVLLPERMLKRTGIEKEITLVGIRDHLEIWNRQAWVDQLESLYKKNGF